MEATKQASEQAADAVFYHKAVGNRSKLNWSYRKHKCNKRPQMQLLAPEELTSGVLISTVAYQRFSSITRAKKTETEC